MVNTKYWRVSTFHCIMQRYALMEESSVFVLHYIAKLNSIVQEILWTVYNLILSTKFIHILSPRISPQSTVIRKANMFLTSYGHLYQTNSEALVVLFYCST